MKTKTSSFTLIELMIVAIIVAILAAVAVALMQGNTKRAMATEAQSAMGMIRTALRANYAETNDYSKLPDGTAIATDCSNLPGIKYRTGARSNTNVGDLDGTYWDQARYTLSNLTANTYTITVTGVANTPQSGIGIILTQSGGFSTTGL